jgi:hypothetical protein
MTIAEMKGHDVLVGAGWFTLESPGWIAAFHQDPGLASLIASRRGCLRDGLAA